MAADVTTPPSAVVETAAGKVRGALDGDVFTFKGIPYGASTAGAARFQRAAPPRPWTGVRWAMSFGPACPQADRPASQRLLDPRQAETHDEDCLHLNVWTRSINDGARRPVMVWLHGGAFLLGTANRPQTWGANLARRRDVVVVSLHHRLNVLGHLDVSVVGDEFAESANVGMLDIVDALAWVREHIASFGGDPDCVTVFGYSGGGAKVATLLTMPAAQGLFHRAIVQSSSSRINAAEQAEGISERFLAHLGVGAADPSPLFEMPVERLVDAAVAVSAAPLNPGDDWRPKIDGTTVLQQPFDPVAPAISAHVPILIGGVRHEFAPEPEHGELPRNVLEAQLAARFGADAAARLLAHFARVDPAPSTNEILALVNVQPFRASHLRNATGAALRHAAPVFAYNFAWKTPNLDGLPLAFHGAELPFVFLNVAECALHTGNTAEAWELAEQVSAAWTTFAATGDPRWRPDVPWDPFDPERVNTMVFDVACAQVDDPWREETDAVLEAVGGMFAKPSAAQLLHA